MGFVNLISVLLTPTYAELPPHFDRRNDDMEIWARNGPRVEALT